MVQRSIIGATLVSLLAGATATLVAQERDTLVASYEVKAQATDQLFAPWNGPDSPGCAVGVIKDGDLIFSRGYGSANLDYGIPLTDSSVFDFASDSKQFTGAAIARMVLDGRLSLDDEARRYVPELPEYGQPIVVRHLIHHTSGIRDYATLMGLAGATFEEFFDNDLALELILRQKALNFRPGHEHLYSNSNYVLLAKIVERVTRQTLQEFTRERFFRPLGMHATHWGEDRTRLVPNRVVSYSRTDDAGYRRWLKNAEVTGDGNLLVTVRDLAKWDRIFYEESEPWASMIELMHTQGVLNSSDTLKYAFGLSIGSYRGQRMINHGGGTLGFHGDLLRFPNERLSVICLCNLESISATVQALQVADIWLYGERAPWWDSDESENAEQPEDSIQVPPPQNLESFAGEYHSEEADATWVLSVEGAKLMLRYPRLVDVSDPVLRWEGNNRFSLEGGTVEFDGKEPPTTFTVDAGRVRGLRFVRR